MRLSRKSPGVSFSSENLASHATWIALDVDSRVAYFFPHFRGHLRALTGQLLFLFRTPVVGSNKRLFIGTARERKKVA